MLTQHGRCLVGELISLLFILILSTTNSDSTCLGGGVIWIVECIHREVQSRHTTYFSKVIQPLSRQERHRTTDQERKDHLQAPEPDNVSSFLVLNFYFTR